jgi:DNA replication initiation complex subunit (GINS family)
MSTKTTSPKISEESRKKIENFKITQQLYNDLDSYIRTNKKTSDRAKQRVANQISELGDDFINELEQNEEQDTVKYKEYAEKVETIIKLSGSKHGTLEKLNDMTYEEIDSIYNKVLLDSKKGFWDKLFDFIMEW